MVLDFFPVADFAQHDILKIHSCCHKRQSSSFLRLSGVLLHTWTMSSLSSRLRGTLQLSPSLGHRDSVAVNTGVHMSL